MQNPTDRDSRSPPHSDGAVTRAQTNPENTTVQPALTSGFGAVIEKEHALQNATDGSLGHVNGQRATELDHILRHQHSRLGANIALLERRYEALPSPERFVSWNDRRHPPVAPRRKEGRNEIDLLPDLIARHAGLLADIKALIRCVPDGQLGELILAEVSRNHEEMASMLTALLKDAESMKRIAHASGGDAPGEGGGAQENWDNEGGPVRVDPSTN
jgi:hypothetical protein